MLLGACGNAETIQPLPPVNSTMTPVVVSSPTRTAVPPTSTPIPPEEAHLACIPNQIIKGWEISPNGAWMTRGFYLGVEKGNLLHVVSLDCIKNWKIYLSDYKEKDSNAPHDDIIPYHWSKDGKFLYAIVGQRMSGCCWIGGRYVLLVRLNLETGEQIVILKTVSNSSETFDFTISDSDRFIIYTPPSYKSYGFVVLDLNTWEKRDFFLEFPKYLDVIYAVMSPDESKIVLPLFLNAEFNDYFVDSVAMIDLMTGKQDLLITGLTQEKELYPIRWIDTEHVLISNTDPFAYHYPNDPPIEYWSLNIKTGLREKVENP